MDASLETALALSAELSKWFDSSIHGLQIPSSDREAMAGALFDQVHEHHKAVHLLLKNSFSGSAFSLVRPMFETFVRGLWLRRCAPDQAIEKFKKDKLELKFELLIDEIESSLTIVALFYRRLKSRLGKRCAVMLTADSTKR